MSIIPFSRKKKDPLNPAIAALVADLDYNPEFTDISYTKASLILFYLSYHLECPTLTRHIQNAMMYAVAESTLKVPTPIPLVSHFNGLSNEIVGELIALSIAGK